MDGPRVDILVDLIAKWHQDRNLIDGSTDKDQYLKLIQEAGELSDNICKGRGISTSLFSCCNRIVYPFY